MKRKIDILIIIIAATAVCASAQTNKHFEKGYSFDIELATARPFDQNAFSTSHGYSFGNGLFVGGGAAFEYIVSAKSFMTPVFAEARWSISDSTVSPYIDLRAGYAVIAEHKDSFYIAPTVGLDIFRFSIFAGWDVIPAFESGFKFGIGFNF